ncbi:CAP domain-containing protein [Streptomyces sp. NPDC051742]|uniref:CAP domain-containing protein n=1 Tax=unclassified Streptomyces TaxID=2593676 RepID=UPI0034472329
MRHHDRNGHPDVPDPDAPREGPAERAGRSEPAARANGRHRRGRVARCLRLRRRLSFRAAVLAAGTTAAALTVATGLYAASPAVTGTTGATGPGAVPPAVTPTVTPTVAEPEAGPGRPTARQAVRPQEQRREQLRAEAPAGKAARYVKDVLALVNAERERAGCGPLRAEKHLRTAAQGHADDMSARDYYEHASPEGRDAGDRMSDAGYAWSTWGENIHRGTTTPSRTVEDWMDSPGHRANILNCSFKDTGVGVALTADGPWWVQDFGARR